MMKIERLPEFEKDLKFLSKKYPTLSEDIDVLCQVLLINPGARPSFSFQINMLHVQTCVVKVKKIASRSFKGRGVNSGFRLIYAYIPEESKIVLVELYHKNTKEVEDRERIVRYFK